MSAGAAAQVIPEGDTGTGTETKTHGWTIVPGVEVGEIFTDNINLAPPGQEKSDFITEISPYLQVSGKSPRVKLKLDYRMQNYIYAETKGGDSIYHLLNANAETVLVKNLLYFQGAGYMSQQIISPTGHVFVGNFSNSGNRTDVRTYYLSPYLQHSFGTTASTMLRYTRSSTSYTQFSQSNSTGNSFSADLFSGPSFYRVNWGLFLSREQIGYQQYPSVTMNSAVGQMGWTLSRTFRLDFTGGYDKNKYVSLSPKNSGGRWSVGFTWAPGRRTSMSASYGRRYYGNNYEFQLKHSTRRTTWDASYTMTATTTNAVQRSSTVTGLINPSSQTNYVNFLFPTLQTQVYILKEAQVGASRSLRAGHLRISAYRLERDYQTTTESTNTYGARGALSWQLSARGTLTLDGSWARYSSNFRSGRYDYLLGYVTYRHQMSRRVYASLQYRRLVNLTENGGGYAENVIAAYLNMQL